MKRTECNVSGEPIVLMKTIIRMNHNTNQVIINVDLSVFLSGSQIINIISKFMQVIIMNPMRLMSWLTAVIGIIPVKPRILSMRSYMKNAKDIAIMKGKSEKYLCVD